MKEDKFDVNSIDSQCTIVEPMKVERFGLDTYQAYELSLLERNKKFVNSEKGIQVYRRFRPNDVFYDGCKDMKLSLQLQLAALHQSMEYEADIANFLEPWYGIGWIAAAFGSDYIWSSGQAPSVKPMFSSLAEINNAAYTPISKTPIGQHILNMIEYFLDQTKGKLPISYSDVQSPLNMISYLLNSTDLFMEMVDDPDGFKQVLNTITTLAIDFLQEQKKLIGDCLAKPGHGFASSRAFQGVGLSADNVLMLSSDMYADLIQKEDERMGENLGGLAFHSCGNWENKIDLIKEFKGIFTIDGAFSSQTDPDFNDPKVFAEGFKNSGIVLNSRIVGDPETVINQSSPLINAGNKVIVVTYCKTPQEQKNIYNQLHDLTKNR